MVGYVSLREQVNADFARARRRSSFGRLRTRLLNGGAPDRLLCFDDTRRRLGAQGGVYRGLREVRSTDVVGSVGRCSEFGRASKEGRLKEPNADSDTVRRYGIQGIQVWSRGAVFVLSIVVSFFSVDYAQWSLLLLLPLPALAWPLRRRLAGRRQ